MKLVPSLYEFQKGGDIKAALKIGEFSRFQEIIDEGELDLKLTPNTTLNEILHFSLKHAGNKWAMVELGNLAIKAGANALWYNGEERYKPVVSLYKIEKLGVGKSRYESVIKISYREVWNYRDGEVEDSINNTLKTYNYRIADNEFLNDLQEQVSNIEEATKFIQNWS